MTGLDLRGALIFTPEAERVEFDGDSGNRTGLSGAPSTSYTHTHTPHYQKTRSAPKRPFSLAATSCVLQIRHRPFREIELPSRSPLFSVPIFSGKRLSSTPLEILFFLNGWYYATYFLLELFIFLYKGKVWSLTTRAPKSLPHFSPLLFCSLSSLQGNAWLP